MVCLKSEAIADHQAGHPALCRQILQAICKWCSNSIDFFKSICIQRVFEYLHIPAIFLHVLKPLAECPSLMCQQLWAHQTGAGSWRVLSIKCWHRVEIQTTCVSFLFLFFLDIIVLFLIFFLFLFFFFLFFLFFLYFFVFLFLSSLFTHWELSAKICQNCFIPFSQVRKGKNKNNAPSVRPVEFQQTKEMIRHVQTAEEAAKIGDLKDRLAFPFTRRDVARASSLQVKKALSTPLLTTSRNQDIWKLIQWATPWARFQNWRPLKLVNLPTETLKWKAVTHWKEVLVSLVDISVSMLQQLQNDAVVCLPSLPNFLIIRIISFFFGWWIRCVQAAAGHWISTCHQTFDTAKWSGVHPVVSWMGFLVVANWKQMQQCNRGNCRTEIPKNWSSCTLGWALLSSKTCTRPQAAMQKAFRNVSRGWSWYSMRADCFSMFFLPELQTKVSALWGKMQTGLSS